MTSLKKTLRRAGVLLHPTSLPSGILDADVERFLQMLNEAGCSVWQVLPLCEPQCGLSPYQCSSAFAFNPHLLPASTQLIPTLEEDNVLFKDFCEQQQYWLDDYVLFTVIKQHFNGSAWVDWPDPWKFREFNALQETRQLYQQQMAELKWQQFHLQTRWLEIKRKASSLNISLFGDMPIFVSHESADVWAHPECFLLDSDGKMTVVSGVPPDYFSETGQLWGNPHYNWDTMRKDDFAWWKARIEHLLLQFDLIRIDHFRGLESVWMVDASSETAIDGHWQKVPGDELLASLQASFAKKTSTNQLPFVAEDLGIITPEVTALRKKYRLPGMSILQFGFDEFDDNPHKLKNIEDDKVVYSGTHDNDTSKGWFFSLQDYVKEQVLRQFHLLDENQTNWRQLSAASDPEVAKNEIADRLIDKLIESALNSRAQLCIIPLQDCLHLGTKARMNIPGTVIDNWQWQFQWQQIDNSKLQKIKTLVESSGRLETLA